MSRLYLLLLDFLLALLLCRILKIVSLSGPAISRSCNIPAQRYLAILLLELFLALLFCTRCLLLRAVDYFTNSGLPIPGSQAPVPCPHLPLLPAWRLWRPWRPSFQPRPGSDILQFPDIRFYGSIVSRLLRITVPPYPGSTISRLHHILALAISRLHHVPAPPYPGSSISRLTSFFFFRSNLSLLFGRSDRLGAFPAQSNGRLSLIYKLCIFRIRKIHAGYRKRAAFSRDQ